MEVEKLYEVIKSETKKYVELSERYGKEHPMARRLCVQICGMQKAFAIVAGMTYTDYLISKIS